MFLPSLGQNSYVNAMKLLAPKSEANAHIGLACRTNLQLTVETVRNDSAV